VLGSSGATAGDQDGSAPGGGYTPYALREGLYQRGWNDYFKLLQKFWHRTLTALLLSTTPSHAWSPRCSAWNPDIRFPCLSRSNCSPDADMLGFSSKKSPAVRHASPCDAQVSSVRLRQTLLRWESLSGRNQFQGEAAASKFVRGMTRPCRSRTGIGNGQAHVWSTNCLEDRERTGRDQAGALPDSDDAFMFYALATQN